MLKPLCPLALLLIVISAADTPLLQIPLKPDKSVPYINLYNISPQCPSLEVILDTGSSDFWLADALCSGCPKRSVNCLQFLNSSSINQKQIHYASGWVKGYVVDYELCGVSAKILCVTQAKDISHFASDGVLGAGGNQTGRQFLRNLFPPASKQKPISLLSRRYLKKLILGKLDSQISEQDDLDSYSLKASASQQWNIDISQITLDEEVVSEGISGMVDTGSQLIALPLTVYQKVLAKIQRILQTKCIAVEIGVSCDCSNSYSIRQLPNIRVQIPTIRGEMKSLVVPPNRYVVWKQRKCILLIANIPNIGNKVILGSPFLNEFPVTFDIESHQLQMVSINHQKLNHTQNQNLFVLALICALIVLALSKLSIWVCRHLDRPNKLII